MDINDISSAGWGARFQNYRESFFGKKKLETIEEIDMINQAVLEEMVDEIHFMLRKLLNISNTE